jgi:hypothetical protein
MNYLKSTALIGAFAISAFAGAALAQEETSVTVDLSGLSKDFSGALSVGVGRVPDTVSVSADIAAAACGVDASSLSSGSTCTAVTTTPELTVVVEDEISATDNSAREFAPGQQEGDAKASAPGQLEQPAMDSAPGHLKNATDDDETSTDEMTNGKDSAPGQQDGAARDSAPGHTKSGD